MHRWLVIAVGVGLAAGALSALGRAELEGTLDAFANSISTWLIAPFAVGSLTRGRRDAAVAGFVTCACQLVGYYAVAARFGLADGAALVVFWSLCAIVGGPVFGLAGRLWRGGVPGLGAAVLASVFIAEGLYAYVHQQHHYATGVLWVAMGVALALLCTRARPHELRWLGLTVPLGLGGEVALTEVLQRMF